MANRYMKGCSTLLVTRKIQNKATMRYHLTTLRMATINNTKIRVGEDVEKKEASNTASGNIN